MFPPGRGARTGAWSGQLGGLGNPLFSVPWDGVGMPLQALPDPWRSHWRPPGSSPQKDSRAWAVHTVGSARVPHWGGSPVVQVWRPSPAPESPEGCGNVSLVPPSPSEPEPPAFPAAPSTRRQGPALPGRRHLESTECALTFSPPAPSSEEEIPARSAQGPARHQV